MREIKFRAWNTQDKKMHYDVYYLGRDVWEWSDKEMDFVMIGCADDHSPLKQTILIQYIGLKDKNGKEIYEGDIYKTENGEIGEVSFCDNTGHGAYTVERRFGHCVEELKFLYWNLGEVTGNIYENPELLEQARKESQ